MTKAYEYKALGFSGEDVDSISVAIDENNKLTVTANLKDGTKKSSEPVALPTGGSYTLPAASENNLRGVKAANALVIGNEEQYRECAMGEDNRLYIWMKPYYYHDITLAIEGQSESFEIEIISDEASEYTTVEDIHNFHFLSLYVALPSYLRGSAMLIDGSLYSVNKEELIFSVYTITGIISDTVTPL